MSRIIEMMSNKSTINIIEGGLLAMLIIFLFLRNLKPTIAIGITIPLSIVVAFIAFYIMGYTLNLITLGGLALGVGMLVDNAVVVIENIFRHLQEGMTPTEAARKGTSEVGLAITGSTLTTVAVFFPMMFATGIAGRLAQSLAVSVIIALMASLFVALTIVPMLAAWMFRVHKKKGAQTAEGIVDLGEDKFTKVRDRYEGWLRKALVHRKKVLIGIIAAFVLSMVGAAFLGTEFMPATDNAMLYLKLSMPVGNQRRGDRPHRQVPGERIPEGPQRHHHLRPGRHQRAERPGHGQRHRRRRLLRGDHLCLSQAQRREEGVGQADPGTLAADRSPRWRTAGSRPSTSPAPR